MQYVEVPVPTPKKDEVLIKVEAASLSPIDWLIQQGGLKPMFPRELPQIPGIFFTFFIPLPRYYIVSHITQRIKLLNCGKFHQALLFEFKLHPPIP